MLKTGARYLAAVAEHGSFRAASESLHVAQSAVSRQIQSLELELGVKLFDRRPRGVTLTQAGDIVFRFVRSESQRFERVISEIDALQGLRRGLVTIASVESLVREVLPAAIDRFRQDYPGVTFSVQIEGSDRVVALVRDAQADIGLAYNVQPSDDLSTIRQVRTPLQAIMAPGHPLAGATSVPVSDIGSWPVALPPRWTGTRQVFDGACRDAGVTPQIAMETNSIELIHRFALFGHGIAFLSPLVCGVSVRRGDLVAVPIDNDAMNDGTIDAVALSMRELPLAADGFLHYLINEITAVLPDVD